MFRRRRDSCYRDYRLDARLKASNSLLRCSERQADSGVWYDGREIVWSKIFQEQNPHGNSSKRKAEACVKQGWVLFTVIGLVIVVVTASVTHKIDHFATIPTADWRSQDPPIKQQTLRLAAQIREFIRNWNDSDDETVQREIYWSS